MIFPLLMIECALSLVAQQPIEQAWHLAASGHNAEAISLLQRLVLDRPNDADEQLLLGSLLMEAGQKERSIEHLREAVRLRPNSEAQNALGEAYNKFGDARAARTAFEKAVALNPSSGIAQLNLGLVLLTAGDYSSASQHLDVAIRLLGRTDDAADAHYLRAKAYTAGGEPQLAENHLRLAVSIRPKFAEAWSDLGQVRRAMLDDVGALAAFKQAVLANPGDAVAQYRLGAEYLRQDQPRLAVEHLQIATQLNSTDQSALNTLQIALRRSGDVAAAASVKQKLADLLLEKDRISQNQLAAVKLNNQGAVLDKAGKLQEAVANYDEASRLYPEHSGIRFNYGLALLRLGRWKEGLDQLREALRRDPDNTTIQRALADAMEQAPQ